MNNTELKNSDVLINIVGATTDVIGRAAILFSDFPLANITQAMALLRIKEKFLNTYNSFFLFSFLSSNLGHKQIRRIARPTGQYNMNLQEVGSIKIPIVSINFQNEIKNTLLSYEKKKAKAIDLYHQAEQILLEELGLNNWQPSADNINTKSFKESFSSTGRLDAEYYQPKYENYYDKVISYKKGYTYIKNEFDQIVTLSPKNKEMYYYIEIGDVNVSDGTIKANYLETDNLPANAKIAAQKNDLLISNVRPNRGAVSIIDTDHENIIVSGAFTVLREKTDSIFSNEILKVLLRLNIYRDWLLKFNIGTQYPVIKDRDILDLPIPKLDEKIQKEIKIKIQNSHSLKHQSEQLLKAAKSAVEIAIEQDENAAIKYINQNTEQV